MTQTILLELTSDAWTLVADGDAGANTVLIQLARVHHAMVHLSASAPEAASMIGIVMSNNAPFACSLLPGQRLYAKARDTATAVVAMVA